MNALKSLGSLLGAAVFLSLVAGCSPAPKPTNQPVGKSAGASENPQQQTDADAQKKNKDLGKVAE